MPYEVVCCNTTGVTAMKESPVHPPGLEKSDLSSNTAYCCAFGNSFWTRVRKASGTAIRPERRPDQSNVHFKVFKESLSNFKDSHVNDGLLPFLQVSRFSTFTHSSSLLSRPHSSEYVLLETTVGGYCALVGIFHSNFPSHGRRGMNDPAGCYGTCNVCCSSLSLKQFWPNDHILSAIHTRLHHVQNVL